MNIEDYIPIGYENRVSREFLAAQLGATDREIRKAIAEAQEPIINVGGGYFLPGDNEKDQLCKRIYIRKELARIKTLNNKLRKFGVSTNQGERL